MKNIIAQLGSEQFPRIKVGIGGKPHPDYDLADWVLSSFRPEEQEAMQDAAKRAAAAVSELIEHGVPSAVQKYNGKGK